MTGYRPVTQWMPRGGEAAALATGARVEPAVGEGPGALIADYRALREETPSRERTQRLGDLLVRLLRASGIEAALRDQEPLVVVFRHDGQQFAMGVAWASEAAGGQAADEFARAVRQAASAASVVLLSMSGFTGQVTGTDSSRTLLWDWTHLEAVVCGLVTLPGLLEASISAAFVGSVPYETLAGLLADSAQDACAGMVTPDRLPSPWPVLEQPYDGIPARLALVGEDGWDKPSGIAALDAGRLVVVTDGGLVELDTARGGTSWIMRLPGCANEPLVLPDGSVLAACNDAIVRVSGSGLEAVAGGLGGNVHLLAGPSGEPWALSGHGAAFGTERSLALTRLGARAGDQHRYDIHFDAQVHTAGWLDGLRFFLAAAGHSAVVDLGRSTRVDRDDWIESPQGYRQHLVVTGPRSVVTAAGGPTALGVTMFRTGVDTRVSEQIAGFVLNGVDGLCTDLDGTGYLLGDVYAARRGSRDPWPVLLRLPGLRPPAATAPAQAAHRTMTAATQPVRPARTAPAAAAAEPSAATADPYDAVRAAAGGKRGDYALDRGPIDRGGQAEVFRARHKPSGVMVAFKRLPSPMPDAVARMRREIEIAQALGGNPHVMSVLDYSDRYDWFVMPLAGDTAATSLAALSQPAELRELVTAICEALRPAHALGWTHRDLKPANLLRLDGTWTVADWGLTRRPRGQTTDPDRTRAGTMFGTEGFAAPELSADAHNAGPQADIYSIGQIIGWALRGQMPQANTPLIPPSGPWRQVARAATLRDPGRRPATVDALLEIIREELDYEQSDDSDTAGKLRAAADAGDETAAAQLFGLAARYPDDIRWYTEVLSGLTQEAVRAGVDADTQLAAEIAQAMSSHVRDPGLSFDDAARIITRLHWIQVRAAEVRDLDLLHQAADAVLTWDAGWDQWTPQNQIRSWLARLRGDEAAVVARALRDHQDAAQHFAEVADNRHADERIRRAVRPAPPASSGTE